MMKSPFLDEELLGAEPRPDFDSTVERLAKESPFLKGLTGASVNLAASEEEYHVDDLRQRFRRHRRPDRLRH